MNSPIEVSLAIIYEAHSIQTNPRFLMQLRDDIPGIVYPGHWGLFGGHLEPGETAEQAFTREVQEEINYLPEKYFFFRCYPCDEVIRHVYCTPLTVTREKLVLQEGWDMDWLTLDKINQGYAYSHQAQQTKPLVAAQRQILLDFASSVSSETNEPLDSESTPRLKLKESNK